MRQKLVTSTSVVNARRRTSHPVVLHGQTVAPTTATSAEAVGLATSKYISKHVVIKAPNSQQMASLSIPAVDKTVKIRKIINIKKQKRRRADQ